MSYWDTSALVKLYLTESDSTTFLAIAETVDRISTASLTRFEARAVFLRKELNGSIAFGKSKLLSQAFLADMQSIYAEVGTNSSALESEFERVLDVCGRATPPISRPDVGRDPHRSSTHCW